MAQYNLSHTGQQLDAAVEKYLQTDFNSFIDSATLNNYLGNLSSLTTTTKSNTVAAINKVKAGVDTNSNAIVNVITAPGTYTMIGCYAGFNTGSGNYVDFFVPLTLGNGRTVSSVTFKGSVFFGTTRHNISNASSVDVLNITKNGIFCEYHYSSTQTASIVASVYAETLTVTVV